MRSRKKGEDYGNNEKICGSRRHREHQSAFRPLEELATFGEVAVCKFYGYSAKRTKDYGEFIQENSYDALSALPRKRKGKLDLRQVIDAARLAQYPNVDGFFLIYGKGDITPLISYLKGYGKDVIAGVIEPDKNSALCNKVITLDLNATIQTVSRPSCPRAIRRSSPAKSSRSPRRSQLPRRRPHPQHPRRHPLSPQRRQLPPRARKTPSSRC